MDLKDTLRTITDRVIKLKDQIQTEEATKNAFVMPFLQALGYDVFNPLEVVPEYVTDIGTKKGEKIDYAIMKDSIPVILIECKHWKQNLNLHDNQLLRYFHVSKAKFGILTNGIEYRFYTDLVEPNKMDEKPFFELSLLDLKDNHIEELKKFHKAYFDIENIVTTASELKYTNEIKHLIDEEFNNPSIDFVKHFAKQVYTSSVTQKVLDQFTVLVKKSLQQHVNDLITNRLKTALHTEAQVAEIELTTDDALIDSNNSKEDRIVTTQEELDGFAIIKSILRKDIDLSKFNYRDSISYFAILFDDNNRKPICRLYFNGTKKSIGIFNTDKQETKYALNDLNDIYNYSDEIVNIGLFYNTTL